MNDQPLSVLATKGEAEIVLADLDTLTNHLAREGYIEAAKSTQKASNNVRDAIDRIEDGR